MKNILKMVTKFIDIFELKNYLIFNQQKSLEKETKCSILNPNLPGKEGGEFKMTPLWFFENCIF